MAAAGEGRNDKQGNARAVAEKVQRLNVPGVIVAAAFVESDDERSVGEEIRPGSQVIHRFFDHAFEEVEFGRCRVTVDQTIRLDERNGRKSFGIDSGEEVRRILDMRGALRGIAHDGRGVGLEVADVAVGSPDLDERTWVIGGVLEGDGSGVRAAVIGPGKNLLSVYFAGGPGIYGGDRAAASDARGVD